ncbi:Bromodomain-containing protein 3 RING3-like protein, partial [Takifugu flavidus]
SWWKQSNFFLRHLSNFLQEDFLQSLSHEDDVICGLHIRQQQLKHGERVDILAGGAAATFSSGSSSALN